MKGVMRCKNCVSKPYCIAVMKAVGKQTKKYYATEAEATAALASYKSTRVQVKRDARQALVGKRTTDIARYGGYDSLERQTAVAMVTAWRTMTGRKALVLNDNTRGDLLLQREDGGFLVVQLKTTRKMTIKNQYRFSEVLGYENMPVVCWCEDTAHGWVADGATLNARKKSCIHITLGARIEREFTRTSGDMQQLLTFLAEHAEDWSSTTEDAARHDFRSKSHQIEMQGIDAYKQSFPSHAYEWPNEQNGHVDLMVDGARAQFKTANIGKCAGLHVHLYTHAGTDHERKLLLAPYPHDAFDILVVVWKEGDGPSHFWRIPATELTTRGYLSTPTHVGKMTLIVHGPVGQQPDPLARNKADTWTRAFYVNS